MTLDQLLALFPDNTSGQITAADLRSLAAAMALLANNLSDLQNVATARANLGLGTAAVASASAFDAAGSASSVAAALAPAGSIGAVQTADGDEGFADSGWSVDGSANLIAPGVTPGATGQVQIGGGLYLGRTDAIGQINFGDPNTVIYQTYPNILVAASYGGVANLSYGANYSSADRNIFSNRGRDVYLTDVPEDETTPWQVYDSTDIATNTATVEFAHYHRTSGTPDVGFGSTFVYCLDSSTNTQRPCAGISAVWSSPTDAYRSGQLNLQIYDWTSVAPIDVLMLIGSADGSVGIHTLGGTTLDDGYGDAAIAGNLAAKGIQTGIGGVELGGSLVLQSNPIYLDSDSEFIIQSDGAGHATMSGQSLTFSLPDGFDLGGSILDFGANSGGTPANTASPAFWVAIQSNGGSGFLPIYQ